MCVMCVSMPQCVSCQRRTFAVQCGKGVDDSVRVIIVCTYVVLAAGNKNAPNFCPLRETALLFWDAVLSAQSVHFIDLCDVVLYNAPCTVGSFQ